MPRKKRSIIRHALHDDLVKWKKEHSADNYSTIKNESEHDIAFKKLFDILHHDLFENKKAFTMSSLLDKLCSLFPEGLLTKYSTAKLQTRLQKHYGDTIVIESQRDKVNQIFCVIFSHLFLYILITFILQIFNIHDM
jgi:hypothetical protein